MSEPDHDWQGTLDALPDPEQDRQLCCPRCWSRAFTAARATHGLILSCRFCDTRIGIAARQAAGVIVSGSGEQLWWHARRRRRFPRLFRYFP